MSPSPSDSSPSTPRDRPPPMWEGLTALLRSGGREDVSGTSPAAAPSPSGGEEPGVPTATEEAERAELSGGEYCIFVDDVLVVGWPGGLVLHPSRGRQVCLEVWGDSSSVYAGSWSLGGESGGSGGSWKWGRRFEEGVVDRGMGRRAGGGGSGGGCPQEVYGGGVGQGEKGGDYGMEEFGLREAKRKTSLERMMPWAGVAVREDTD